MKFKEAFILREDIDFADQDPKVFFGESQSDKPFVSGQDFREQYLKKVKERGTYPLSIENCPKLSEEQMRIAEKRWDKTVEITFEHANEIFPKEKRGVEYIEAHRTLRFYADANLDAFREYHR